MQLSSSAEAPPPKCSAKTDIRTSPVGNRLFLDVKNRLVSSNVYHCHAKLVHRKTQQVEIFPEGACFTLYTSAFIDICTFDFYIFYDNLFINILQK